MSAKVHSGRRPERKTLSIRAAELLMESYGQRANIKITLTKNIPAGTGLGSASSDAAATLIGLNKYLGLELPLSTDWRSWRLSWAAMSRFFWMGRWHL